MMYYHHYGDQIGNSNVKDEDMMIAIRLAITKLGLERHRIISSTVGTHLFRAGGSMAIKFSGAGRDYIKKMESWGSDKFLVYIHDQIV